MTAVLERTTPPAEPAPTPPPSRRSTSGIGILGPVAVLGLLFVYPVVTVVRQSFQDRVGHPNGTAAWKAVLASQEFRTGLLNTVDLAVGATIGCLVLGTFLAVVLAFVPFPGSAAISRMTTVVLAFPSFFIALSFAVLYGRTGVVSSLVDALGGTRQALGGFIYTPWAVLLAEITFFTPFVMRPVLAACKQMQVEQLQVAANLGATPWRVVRLVLLPELFPSIAAGSSLCLLLTLNQFGIVLFIGAKGVLTLPVMIYTKGIVAFDYPSAAVLACVQVALSLVLYGLGRLVVSRIGGHRAGME
jgi:2-aminoethylphosphonate transport system permease protein